MSRRLAADPIILRAGAIALALALAPGVAWAGRPLDTEDTETREPGQFELQLGVDHARSTGEKAWTLSTELDAGVLPKLELDIQATLGLLDRSGKATVEGPGDTLLSGKYRWLDETPTHPAVLTEVTLRLPTGDSDRGLGVPGVDVRLLLAGTKNLGLIALFANVGYAVLASGPDDWLLNGAAAYHVTKAWTLVGELVSTVSTGRRPNTSLIRGGATYLITGGITLDGAVGVGLTRERPDVLLRGGITIDF